MGNKQGKAKTQDVKAQADIDRTPPTSDETMAWTVPEKDGKLVLQSYTMPALGANDVQIRVTHNGLCHTDLHMKDNDWGISKYPLIPGHEVVGVVSHVGAEVSLLRPGQRVGVGWIKGSCGSCVHCNDGFQNHCKTCYKGLIVGVGAFKDEHPCGGFAQDVRVGEKFAFPLPEKLSSAQAAPLLCAGATVYNPIKSYVKKGMKVAICGIGGLGHVAIQMAVAMGAEVTAVSSSSKKKRFCSKIRSDRIR